MIYCPIGFWGGSFASGKTCSINRESYIVAPGDNRESPGHGMEGGFPEESESRISIGFVKYNGRKKMKKKKIANASEKESVHLLFRVICEGFYRSASFCSSPYNSFALFNQCEKKCIIASTDSAKIYMYMYTLYLKKKKKKN